MGARACIGAGLTTIVLQKVLAMVLSRYKILSRPRFPGDPAIAFGFGIPPKDEIRVQITHRGEWSPQKANSIEGIAGIT